MSVSAVAWMALEGTVLSEKKKPMSTGQHMRCHRAEHLTGWGEVGRLAT